MSKQLAPEEIIATRVFEVLERHGEKHRPWQGVVRQIKEFLREVDDFDQVYLVCEALAERDAGSFKAWSTLSWRAFWDMSEQLSVPSGAGGYVRRIRELLPSDREQAQRLLDAWVDAEADGRDLDASGYEQRLRYLLGELVPW